MAEDPVRSENGIFLHKELAPWKCMPNSSLVLANHQMHQNALDIYYLHIENTGRCLYSGNQNSKVERQVSVSFFFFNTRIQRRFACSSCTLPCNNCSRRTPFLTGHCWSTFLLENQNSNYMFSAPAVVLVRVSHTAEHVVIFCRHISYNSGHSFLSLRWLWKWRNKTLWTHLVLHSQSPPSQTLLSISRQHMEQQRELLCPQAIEMFCWNEDCSATN